MDSGNEQMDEYVVAGVIGSPRGLQGEVSVMVRTDWPEERFFPGAELLTTSPKYPELTISSVSEYKGRLFVKFAEVASRQEAEKLKHAELLVPPILEEDAWYVSELEGLVVKDGTGKALGTVSGLQVGPAQDLLEVQAGTATVLVPLVEEIVSEVDVARGFVTVVPPAGLFPDTESS